MPGAHGSTSKSKTSLTNPETRRIPQPLNVSVVVPLHNEEPNVERLLAVVPASLARNSLVDQFEIICVDDGSTDRTGELLLRGRSDRLVVLSIPGRSGQSAALARGIAAARYDIIGLLDGDLQTTPDDFALLLPWLERGFGCVHGIRTNRQDPLVRRASSLVARVVRQLVLGDDFQDISCPLSVFRKACLTGVPLFDPFHRYLPYLIQVGGYAVKQVPVRHFPRIAGRTKYGIANRLGPGLRSLLAVRRLARKKSG